MSSLVSSHQATEGRVLESAGTGTWRLRSGPDCEVTTLGEDGVVAYKAQAH